MTRGGLTKDFFEKCETNLVESLWDEIPRYNAKNYPSHLSYNGLVMALCSNHSKAKPHQTHLIYTRFAMVRITVDMACFREVAINQNSGGQRGKKNYILTTTYWGFTILFQSFQQSNSSWSRTLEGLFSLIRFFKK